MPLWRSKWHPGASIRYNVYVGTVLHQIAGLSIEKEVAMSDQVELQRAVPRKVARHRKRVQVTEAINILLSDQGLEGFRAEVIGRRIVIKRATK
jgi:sulfite reductase beta subunit-like hemoprotein